MIGLKEATLTVLAFELVQDAEKTPEENLSKEEEFKNRCQNWQQRATDAGITCNCNLFREHDSLIATLLISKAQFKDLDELTLGKEILKFTGDIGQTVVLFAQPEEGSDLKKLAQDCSLGLGLDQDAYLRPRELFGSSIFEAQTCGHFWFWFDTNPSTKNEIQEKWHEIRKLLLYRSKVLYAYRQAKTASQRADELHLELIGVCQQVQEAVEVKVGTSLEQRQQELETLKERLKEISQIGFNIFEEIRFLKYSQNTIRVNSANYLHFYKELGSPVFLREFYQQSQRQLLEQVTSDLNYITPSYDLANQAIATIRGFINIEQARCEQENQMLEERRDEEKAKRDRELQDREKKRDKEKAERDRELQDREKKRDEEKAKRDRKLQDTVEAISIALGAVAIIASFAGMLEKPLCIPLGQKCSWLPHPFLRWVVSSMFLGLLFYQLVLWFKTWVGKVGEKKDNKKHPSSVQTPPKR
jgi:hypothetical protein